MAKRGRPSMQDKIAYLHTQGIAERPEPPDSLEGDARALWQEIVDSLPPDYFRPGDMPLLQAYCVASIANRRACALAQEALAQGDVTSSEARAAMRSMSQTSAVMAQLATKLRLAHSSRISGKVAATQHENTAAGKKPWQDE